MNARVATLRNTTLAGNPPGRQTPAPRAARAWAAAASDDTPYAGEERRKQERRRDERPTTLDTRKDGLDRRVAGRISVKV
jgi:hypothetical protein